VDRYNHPLSIVGMVAMCQPGGITLTTTPVLLASFLQSGHFTQGQAATLGSGELAGMTIGLILTSLIVARVDRRWYALGAILLAVTGHLLSIYTAQQGSFLPTIAVRFVAGLGEGAVTGVGVAALAGLSVPDRGFGFAVTGNLIGGAIMFALMPRLEAAGGFQAILTVIAGYTILFGLAIPLLPRREPGVSPPGDRAIVRPSSRSLLPGLMGLGGMLLFLAGIGAVWPITPQIGLSRGVPPNQIAAALALAGFAGAATGLFVGWLGTRFGRIPPMMLGALGLAGAMLSLLVDLGDRGFMLNAILLMTFWIFSVPYYLGALAAMDESGRLVTMSMAMQTFGLAAGQALAAWLVSGGAGFGGAVYTGATLIASAVLLMCLALRAAQRRAITPVAAA
jgi:predicted MFS family arabinose efflux permease